MAIPWECTRKRRRRAHKTSREQARLPKWVVPHRLTGKIYLKSYKKPAQGHDSSLGRTLRISLRHLENKFTRCSAVVVTVTKGSLPVLFACRKKCNSTRKRHAFFDLCPIKSSFKHNLFYSQCYPASGEISFKKNSSTCC